MKEYTKKFILLIVICFITIVVLISALKINEKRKADVLSTSQIKQYLTEIKYEEIENYIVEQPSIIIYVSNSVEDSTRNFDKILIPVIKKYNLENDVIYININGITIVDPVYQNAPELIFYDNGEISDMVDVNTLNTSKDVVNILKERSVIGD